MKARASEFFDGDGVFGETGRLRLRRPVKADLPALYATLDDLMRPIYQVEAKPGELLRKHYWEAIEDEGALYCTIVSKDDGAVCGYCAIENLDVDPPVPSVRLVPERRGNGLGVEALRCLMAGVERVNGPTECVVRVEPDNALEQHLARELGFEPAGIVAPFIDDEEFLAAFEEENLGNIDDALRALAAEFDVEPRRLLSHVLVYRRKPAVR